MTVAVPVGELVAGGGACKALTAVHRTPGHISHGTVAYAGTGAVKPAEHRKSGVDATVKLEPSAHGTYVHRRLRRLQ